MGSMHVGLEDSFSNFDRLAAYFAERAAGGVGLIVTGGFSPNIVGTLAPFSSRLSSHRHAKKHQILTKAVHAHEGKICLQILHAGRYSYTPFCVAPSAIKSPISPFKPKKLSQRQIKNTISDFVNTTALAQDAGYDGVEIMGSEGYLLNQFISAHVNQRDDEWGGSYENRIRFPLEIVRQARARVGKNFIIIFRLSMLDLIKDGSTWDEIVQLAQALEKAGVTILNTGIGWHEARVPTIATMVPRGAFTKVTARLKPHVHIPLITTNRINTPEVAEDILTRGDADMVSMARPFLADANFMHKAAQNKADEINTCIACNQACLDNIFSRKQASCLVNPQAAYETQLVYDKATPKKVAVVGAGPAGLACSVVAASRGHHVTLYEAQDEIGGQFKLAQHIPGKEEFAETLRYYRTQIKKHNIELKLGNEVRPDEIIENGFDHVVVATGVKPRWPAIPGINESPLVVSYPNIVSGQIKIAANAHVAIIGAGGIGFDVAELLSFSGVSTSLSPTAFLEEWGVDLTSTSRGGLVNTSTAQHFESSGRTITLMQRKRSRPGTGLAKTTGWIRRSTLKKRGVNMITGVEYTHLDGRGVHYTLNGEPQHLKVDHIVICAGQESQNAIAVGLESISPNLPLDIIGGASKALELDAQRAIREGSEIGARL